MKAKDIQRMIDALSREGNALLDRHMAANHRADLLSQSSHSYEEETTGTQTPEECEKLDRMIDIANKAKRHAERLEERRNLVMDACAKLDEALDLAKPSRRVRA